jgi:putative FmdB family regulatory protein
MPIYEYECDSCGSRRELILKPGATARPSCAACRKRMRRLISPTSFILKGSGWYVTDYPSDARKKGMEGEKRPAAAAEKPAGADKAAADKPAAKETPAKESKPAAAPAAAAGGARPRKKKG